MSPEGKMMLAIYIIVLLGFIDWEKVIKKVIKVLKLE